MAMSDDSNDVLLPDIASLLGLPASLPTSSTAVVEFGAQSRRGHSRPMNEDHYLVIRLSRSQEALLSSLSDDVIAKGFDEYGYAMVVADGMGGSGAGEFASRLAIVALMHLVRHLGKWNLRIDARVAEEIMARAEQFYRHVDSAVVRRGTTGNGPDLQTTLTAAFGAGRDLFFAHVGHSRAYLLREGKLMRLTRDHTIGRHHATKVPVAPLVSVNAGAPDLAHILTDTIGMTGAQGPQIDLERFQLADRDRVLVCTNGLTDMIDEDVIAELLASDRTPDDHCRTLVELAMAIGGHDDATAVVAHYHIPE